MKKFLCFVIAASLALAPVAVFADEYDNGENGYEAEADEYYNGEEDNAEEYENGEVEVEAISDELGQRWSFGLGGEVATEQGIDGWYFSYSLPGVASFPERAEFVDGAWVPSEEIVYGEWLIDNVNGYMNTALWEYDGDTLSVSAVLEWSAPVSGTFMLTGSVFGEDARVVVIQGLLAEESIVDQELYGEYDFVELHYYVEMNAGQVLFFIVHSLNALDEEPSPASTNWNIAITEVLFEGLDEEDEELSLADEEEQEVSPMDDVEVRYVGGTPFVAFRAAAVAYGFNQLAWNGATGTVSILVDGEVYFSFVVAEVGGINTNGTIYVPLSFALEAFEG